MATEIMESGDKFRTFTIFVIRWCFRSVLHHPFIVGMLSFLMYLYISSPFVFSLLVSTSPVLICTALLLGTLLSYGESKIPEIREIGEKTACDSVLVEKIEEVPLDSSLAERDESFNLERYNDELGLLNASADVVLDEDDSADDTTPLIGETPRRIEPEDDEACEEGRYRADDSRKKQKIELIEDDETSEHHQYAPIPDVDDGDGESDTDSFDSQKVNVDSLDSPPHSPWSRIEETEEKEGINEEDYGSESSSPDASMAEIRPMLDELHPLLNEEPSVDDGLKNEHEEEDGTKNDREEEEKEGTNEEDAVSDSESYGSESSSPDASMAEIRPMLDELHPLLNEEPSVAVSLHNDVSEHSSESSSDNQESEDEEEEDDAKNDREEETNSAITWTEEDQKNVMDLGSSEVERNLRLEHLITRRRSRRNLASEKKNLIAFEGFELPFSVPSITTRRRNPFVIPEDSPPIPGSAPSVLLPRRNPFDLPYDSSEEKPDLKGDSFEEEFKALQARESLFRRYESFKVGPPSSLAPEMQNVMRMRPYFVPERTFSEDSSSSVFQRQSSGVSESKVSSVPETESLGSVDDNDLGERKGSEENDDVQEPEAAIITIEEDGSSREHQLIISETEERNEAHVITHIPVEDATLKIEVDCDIGHGSESSEEEGDVHVLELETQLGDACDDPYPEDFITHRSVEFEHAPSEIVVQRQSGETENKIYGEVFRELIVIDQENGACDLFESSEHINGTESLDEEHVLISEYDARNQDRERLDTSLSQNTDTNVSDEAMHEPTSDDLHLPEVHAPISTPEKSNVVDIPKILEEADAVVGFDQELLSELDFVGDFSNNEVFKEATNVDCSVFINTDENISGASEVKEQGDEVSMDKDDKAMVGDDEDSRRVQSQRGSTHQLHETEARMMLEDTDFAF